LVFQLYPTLAESYAHFRNFSIYKGNNVSYIPNDGSGCFISVGSNYYTGATSAFSRFNMGNVSGYTGDYYFPTTSVKATNGVWSQGVTSSDDIYKFVYMSNQNLVDNQNDAERFCLPAATGEDVSYDILTTKNVTVDEWTNNDFSISNMAISNTNIYGTTIYITGVCDITVLNLSGPINGSWSWGSEKTIFTINSSLSSSNPKKYNAFYGGSAQAAASYGTNGSATFYKHGNGTTIGCTISANPASGQYVQGQIVLVHLYS
jgi:hypothetical protein